MLARGADAIIALKKAGVSDAVLNAMIGAPAVVASSLANRAWAWSKCSPLRVGDTFLARLTPKGFVVEGINGKSKEQEATYAILQSRSSSR